MALFYLFNHHAAKVLVGAGLPPLASAAKKTYQVIVQPHGHRDFFDMVFRPRKAALGFLGKLFGQVYHLAVFISGGGGELIKTSFFKLGHKSVFLFGWCCEGWSTGHPISINHHWLINR